MMYIFQLTDTSPTKSLEKIDVFEFRPDFPASWKQAASLALPKGLAAVICAL
jgi:hypothetical protein